MEDLLLCPESVGGVLSRTEADPEPAGDDVRRRFFFFVDLALALALDLSITPLKCETIAGVGTGTTPHRMPDLASLGGLPHIVP